LTDEEGLKLGMKVFLEHERGILGSEGYAVAKSGIDPDLPPDISYIIEITLRIRGFDIDGRVSV
jgi:hypothetical protein